VGGDKPRCILPREAEGVRGKPDEIVAVRNDCEIDPGRATYRRRLRSR
jgi:hypothetical protein